MTKQTPKVALSAVAKLQERLGQVPTHQAAEVSKQRAIGLLMPQLQDMHAKGYTWRAIAGLLSEEGLQVTPTALQGYVRRANSELASEAASRRKAKRSPTPGAPPPHAASLSMAPKTPTAAAGPVTTAPPRDPSRSAAPAGGAPPLPADPARRASVTPRRDTDES